jgi:hypothetical protein
MGSGSNFLMRCVCAPATWRGGWRRRRGDESSWRRRSAACMHAWSRQPDAGNRARPTLTPFVDGSPLDTVLAVD